VASATFYGARLREVREARGYSLQQVADHLGITKQAVSLYERSMREPRPDHFQKLVEYLRVPSHYFSRPPLSSHVSPTFYRSMSTATKKMRDSAEQKVKWLREIVGFLSQYVELKPATLPTCHFPSDPNRITTESIENGADELRQFWNLGAGVISNVVHLLENKGIVVARFPLDAEKLDAFSFVEDGTERPYIILSADKKNFFRSRHDAGHELGHLILHRNVPAPVLRDPKTFRNMEIQAHRFASAFLLPARTFRRERITSDVNSFKNIKLKWKSAISAMIMRAGDLGLLPESRKEFLMITLGRKGWRRQEPFDDQVQPERPRFFARACEMIVSELVLSKAGVLNELALERSDVEAILGLDNFFDENPRADSEEPMPVLRLHRPA
jgi:Zn-dependent peptidase ImmA (M78 family)/transcriptional regulator with XRE-family HTH domain